MHYTCVRTYTHCTVPVVLLYECSVWLCWCVQGLKAEQKTEEVKDLNVRKKQMESQMKLVTAMSRGHLPHVAPTQSSIASDNELDRPKIPPKPSLPAAKVKDSKVRIHYCITHCHNNALH